MAALAGCFGIPPVEVEVDSDQTVTSEDGTSVDIVLTLARRPTSVITVRAVSSDETEGTVSEPVRFDQENWDVPQIITVAGVDDPTPDGDVAYDVLLFASSSRKPSHPQLVKVLHFVNKDNEGALCAFEGLGALSPGDTASFATDVSADGNVVVGYSSVATGDEAFRWTPEGGLEGLGGPDSQALAVSPNGMLIAGSVAEPTFDFGRAAALWVGDEPFQLLPGPDVSPGRAIMVVAGRAVLDDGRVFGTCLFPGGRGRPLACRWDAPLQIVGLGESHVFAADPAGNYAGTRFTPPMVPFSSQAMYNGEVLPYPADVFCDVITGCEAEARDFSAGGEVIVGTSLLPPPSTQPVPGALLEEHALVYTAAEGATRLPDLASGDEGSGAFAVSAVGRLIAGFGTSEGGQEAALWLDRAPRRLADVLAEGGCAPDAGWLLLEVRAMTPDGRTVVGNAINPAGNPEAFRVELPALL